MSIQKRLWLTLGIALAIRWVIVITVGQIDLTGDEVDFNHLALQLVSGEGFGYGVGDTFVPTSYRPPGQSGPSGSHHRGGAGRFARLAAQSRAANPAGSATPRRFRNWLPRLTNR